MTVRAALPVALLAVLAGCRSPDKGVGPAPPPPAPKREPITLRLLYTSDEHGFIQPVHDEGKPFRDGAAVLLGLWRSREGHCVPSASDRCEGSATVALSGGDNWTGPAISSFWKGQSAAEVLRRVGYSASALGNHEMDFGRTIFERNRDLEGFPYVAANVSPSRAQGGVADKSVLVVRKGVTLGVVGLSTRDTVKAGLRDNYKGLTFGDEEDALAAEVPAVWAKGADAVVVVAHVCARELARIVERHPEWRLAFVGAGHCHRNERKDANGTPIVEPGSFLRSYVRAELVVDPSRAQKERVTGVAVETLSLERPKEAAPLADGDHDVTEIVGRWQAKTTEALGEVVGHANARLEPDSPPLTNFITDAWRKATGADVAILNRFATRQAIPIGPVKRETIVSVLPFDNRLVTVTVTGEELEKDVRCCGGHVSGVVEKDGVLFLADGKPIDKARKYKVVSTDYAYFGGSDFPFEKQDPNGVFGEDWREPIFRLLGELRTTKEKGLETVVDATPRLATSKEQRR